MIIKVLYTYYHTSLPLDHSHQFFSYKTYYKYKLSLTLCQVFQKLYKLAKLNIVI